MNLLLALALFAPSLQGDPAGTQQDAAWESLVLPVLAIAPPPGPLLPRLLDGRHVLPRGLEARDAGVRGGVHLPLPALASLLQEDAARARRSLRLQPGGPPVLARGEPSALAAARAVLAGLESSGRALDVDLAVWLTPGAGDLGTHPAREVFEAAVAGAAPLGRARVRSGGSVALGARRRRQFVAGYDVQIASGSSVAAPTLGEVVYGRTLHLRVARAAGGRAVVLEGLLDLADAGETSVFDTDRADLGRLEQPEVPALQVVFAGRVESGGVLAVSIAGSELATPDWTLWIRAETQPDPARPGPWRVRDLAWLDSAPLVLPLARPGAGFDELMDVPPSEGAPASFGASALAQSADAARGAGSRAGRTPIVWAPGLLLAPESEAELWREIEALAGAVELERLRGAALTVRHRGLRVTLPVLEGAPARVLAGRERAVLTGYTLEVATDTWMPRPLVSTAFDGVLVQGVLSQGELVGTAWRADSGAARTLERATVGLARLETRERSFACAALRRALGTPVGPVIEATEGLAAVEIGLAAR